MVDNKEQRARNRYGGQIGEIEKERRWLRCEREASCVDAVRVCNG